ncbi:MAG TPA: response regulator [Thermoanaerobaculia bacterium]|nr:response regulator [Thermoanaerobaculia bacterium]
MVGRILLLEPDAEIRTMVTRILQRAGYEVVATSGGVEAVREYERRTFDLLIVDISIYGSVLEEGAHRGIGFLHFLERMHPAQLERLILTTALPDRELPADLPKARILRKPFDIDELLRAVGGVVQAGAA